MLQQARALEKTEYFREQYRQRVVVEHRIARLVQLGTRKSRFLGPAKTRFQLLMAVTVANLTLVANWRASGDFSRRVWAALAASGNSWTGLSAPARSWHLCVRWQATAPDSAIGGGSGLKHRFRSPHELAPRNWPPRPHTIVSHHQKGTLPAGFLASAPPHATLESAFCLTPAPRQSTGRGPAQWC